ncbi:hypothetical protein [Arhodomonas sp. AD133]|uniref:hypothetical protein n=1 Tax=Arhodomonas sp. AD133 TaxID=3415009 RepID=UPI003EB6EE22
MRILPFVLAAGLSLAVVPAVADDQRKPDPLPNLGDAAIEGMRDGAHMMVDQLFGDKRKRIIGYREEWVPGKPMEECIGPDKELNENVLRCRHGYKRRVPIYADE